MTLKQKTEIKTVALQGGAITVREKPLLPFGAFSMVQNKRGKHPGFENRKGSAQHHTTYLGALKTLSLHQFSKGKRTERHFLAQMSDDDVYDASDAPPATGDNFSDSAAIFTGTATSKPASWGNLDDVLLFSNGTDQHQVYAGTDNYVKRFVKYDHASAAPPDIPTDGFDYTQDVTDGKTSSFAVLDSLDTLANYECIFICCPVPAKRLYWTFVSGKENATVRTGTLSYWKSSTNDWADTAETDETLQLINGGSATLGKDGAMTWTTDTDEVPKMMYGYSGFWYRWEVLVGALSGEVEVSSVTYGSDFSPLQNVWDGTVPYAIEAQHFDKSATSIYKRFSSDAVEIDSMEHEASQTADDKDRLFFSTPDPVIGVYIDVGQKPNLTTTTTIDGTDGGVKVWCGASNQSVGTVVDGTNGLNNSGWITWGRPPYNTSYYPERTQFQKSQYYAYSYYIWVGTASLSSDVIISITTMPYFDIEEFGAVGYVSCAWKDRAVYNFGDNLGYVTAKLKPMALNGPDFGVLEAGDGRSNRWVCTKKFHNELLVWQQERGDEGGCLTLFEGYSPETFGKLLLSSRVGTLNAKSAVVVDGVMTSTRTDEALKTLAFFISHYGVFASDGRTVSAVSDDIQNYFDTTESECLRRGYDDEAFIFHDTSCNVLRLGLVSGEPIMTSTATATTGDKLIDSAGAFTTTKAVTGHPIIHEIAIGDTVYNTTDSTSALITAVNSATDLSIDTDIMADEEGYQIFSGTVNLYPVFDLADWTWSFDTLGQALSAMCEVEAASGDLAVLQYGGGTNDGFIYRLNTGLNDYDAAVKEAIDSYITMEFNGQGEYLNLRELLVLMKAQTGDLTVTITQNALTGTSLTLSMAAENTSEIVRRHRTPLNITNQHISIKLQHNAVDESCYLEAVGVNMKEWENR